MIFILIFPIVFLVLAIWEIATGRIRARNWRDWITRQENPKLFWTIIMVRFAFVLVSLGFTIYLLVTKK